MPAIEECLLVPFQVRGKAWGRIWAITHSERRKFDAEDERLMNTLGQFASLAYQTLPSTTSNYKCPPAKEQKKSSPKRERGCIQNRQNKSSEPSLRPNRKPLDYRITGGRLWAGANSGPGVTFQLTLPVEVAAFQTV